MPHKQSLRVHEEGLKKGTLEHLRRTILEVVEHTLRDCQTEQAYCIDFQGTQIVAREMDLKKFIFNVSSYITMS